MELQHVNIKIFVADDLSIEPVHFINIFHRWIQTKAVDELLIDVVDYRHVPAGPGVMLIGHEADYNLDHAGNRYGLRYNRKAAVDGSNVDRFHQALRAAAKACLLLESEYEGRSALKFNLNEFELFINDRALAPNTPETFQACKSELETFLKSTLGHDSFDLTHNNDPRQRTLFGVTVKTSTPFNFEKICSS